MSDVISRCRLLAECTEEPGFITRSFLSEPMHAVHAHVRGWMEQAGMGVMVDHAGNIRGRYPSERVNASTLFIGSHLDTVPHAGAFDGILGVMLAIELVERLGGRRLPFAIEVIGFSEEEGIRFGVPFIGSRAFIGDIDEALLAEVRDAVTAFGLNPNKIGDAQFSGTTLGYLEFHIEQGPVLESLDLSLGIVEGISGQTRLEIVFEGRANHAGTTPMHLRRDGLTAAAEWIGTVEKEAQAVPGAVATVGRMSVSPGATNVIPGSATASLDLRHVNDGKRHALVERLLKHARQISSRRCIEVSSETYLDQPSIAMDSSLTQVLERAVVSAGYRRHRMPSGAGHDAMIVAPRMPAAMLFLRSPGGISHHPDETVLSEDVAAALDAGLRFLEELERRHA
jgi:allantoate deiminase